MLSRDLNLTLSLKGKFTHKHNVYKNKMYILKQFDMQPFVVWDSCWSAAINNLAQEVVMATNKLMPGCEC